MSGWLTPAAVVAHVQVKGVTSSTVPLVNACAAAEAWVEGTARRDLPWAEVGYQPPADVRLGALMLAWRWYERRTSPLGVVQSASGDPVEMLRNDPDIARLLGVGRSARFVFGAGTLPDEDVTP